MNKLAFMTGYQSGLDNAVDQMQKRRQEKTAVIVPENKRYGVAPEALQAYQYEKQQKNMQKQKLAKILGITVGSIGGGTAGFFAGGPVGAGLGAIAGGTIGGGVAHGLTDEGAIGADMDQGRPVADVVRDLKIRQGGPGSSYEEKYMKPFKRSEIK